MKPVTPHERQNYEAQAAGFVQQIAELTQSIARQDRRIVELESALKEANDRVISLLIVEERAESLALRHSELEHKFREETSSLMFELEQSRAMVESLGGTELARRMKLQATIAEQEAAQAAAVAAADAARLELAELEKGNG